MINKITCEPVMFLYSIVYMTILSIMPQLVVQKLCIRKHIGNVTSCDAISGDSDETLQKEASNIWFFVLASSQIPAVFTTLLWGPVSDLIGRRKALMVIPVLSIIQCSVFLVSAHYMKSHPGFLCMGMFVSCLFGEFPGVIGLSCGYIADVTPGKAEKSRVSRLALVDACVIIAYVPAGIIASQLLKAYGFKAVFMFNIAIDLVILIYIIFSLPDPRNIKQEISEKQQNDDNTSKIKERNNNAENAHQDRKFKLLELFKFHRQIKLVYKVISAKERRHLVLPPLCAFIFAIFAFVGELTTTALFIKGKPLLLSADYIGYYYANQGVIRCIGVILVSQLAFKVFKLKDISVILIGLSSQIVCYALIGCSNNTVMVFISNAFGLATQLGFSTLRGYTTKKVPPENCGALLGAFASIDALSYTLNLISFQVYNAAIPVYPGILFIFLSGCSVISFSITVVYKLVIVDREVKQKDMKATNIDNPAFVLNNNTTL